MKVTKTVDDIVELRIFNVLADVYPELNLDKLATISISNWGLVPKSWNMTKGKKDTRNYTESIEVDSKTAIRIRYEYQLNGKIVVGFHKVIEYLKFDDTVGMSKELHKELSSPYLVDINRIIRQNQIDYLVGNAQNMRSVAEMYPEPKRIELIELAEGVESVFMHFKQEIEQYISIGSSSLLTAITNENTEPYKKILDTINPNPALPISMRDIIIYQIS